MLVATNQLTKKGHPAVFNSVVSRAMHGGRVNMICDRKTHSSHPKALGLIMGAEHIPPNDLACDHIEAVKLHLLSLGVESFEPLDAAAFGGIPSTAQEYFDAGS
jgi:hypothetical protein